MRRRTPHRPRCWNTTPADGRARAARPRRACQNPPDAHKENGVPAHARPLRDGDLLAAVDLGSNSFHMVVARYEQGAPRLIDRLRESVRLAAGLRTDGTLDPAHRALALNCLSRFGQRLAGLRPERVRAVATNTVRRLRAPQGFLRPAERALGHSIEVVSGREEARLIWQGVSHALPSSRRNRLVIDVGGGSTEFIIGRGLEPRLTESVQIGCVASTLRFFPDGRITRRRWRQAFDEIGVLLQQFAAQYRSAGWHEAWGASGTVKALAAIARALDAGGRGLTTPALDAMGERLIRAGSARENVLPGLSKERAPIVAGGIVIVQAAFAALGIERLDACDNSMREGLLWDMIGRAAGRDPRVGSVQALARRYGTESAQAARVAGVADELLLAVQHKWRLDGNARDTLAWAARVHEIGLSIAHSQHHRHAGYILRHSDLAGFNREEQQLLAAVVENHRRKPNPALINELPLRLREPAARVTALLRLAVLLCRARSADVPRPRRIEAGTQSIRLALPRGWSRSHPLTLADLQAERDSLKALGVRLLLTRA
ncbi:MAG: Ppx/GppA family phosphatase [Proteobacteria bacterium]|nr:Ppx/GppA family phosphatase [Pseudomonadota bacterium]